MRELCPVIDLNWYALHVRYQNEIRIGQLLASKGWKTLVPVYRQNRQWSDRVKEIEVPLFAGYVFCRFSRNECRHLEGTPGVLSTIRFNGEPAPIQPHEIEGIQTMLTAQVRIAPWPVLKNRRQGAGAARVL